MNVITVANTRQLPGGKIRYLCVVAPEEAEAVRELEAIAARDGLTLSDTVYRFARVYWYATVVDKK